MTRIIFAVTNDLASDQRVHKVITSLLKKNTDIILVGRKLPDSLPIERPYKTVRLRLSFTKGPLFYASFNLRLFFFLLFSRVNLIVANDLDTLAACYLASRLRRCPLVYDSHEYFTEVPELLHRPTVRRIWLWIEKKILPSIKTSYTVCQSIATIYREKYGIPMQVIPNYPNQKKQVEPTQKNKHQRIILYQGMLNMGRGIELAIASMQNTQDMLLWIIGDGYMKKSLAAHVKAHDVQEKVVFLGKIFEPELSQYTRQASLGISLEEDLGENYRYALPNKLFSYIQAGVPVIVSDLPEMKKIVSHYQNGCILSERTPEKLAALYKKMFNASDYEGYRERTREAANELIWEKQEETLFKLYEPYLS